MSNRIGEQYERRPISLPRLVFLADPDDLGEAAERLAITRVVRKGRDRWEEIGKAETFSAWCDIGTALAIGKAHALKVTGANRAWGQHYSREFGQWIKANGFDRMPKSTRSVAIELHENAEAIEAWRETLPERQRKRLIHPLSNVRRWRAATAGLKEPRARDLQHDALIHWRRFQTCLAQMPEDQAAYLWRLVSAEIEERETPSYCRMWRTTDTVPAHVGMDVGTDSPSRIKPLQFKHIGRIDGEGWGRDRGRVSCLALISAR